MKPEAPRSTTNILDRIGPIRLSADCSCSAGVPGIRTEKPPFFDWNSFQPDFCASPAWRGIARATIKATVVMERGPHSRMRGVSEMWPPGRLDCLAVESDPRDEGDPWRRP